MAFDAHKNLAIGTVATPPSPPGTGSTVTVGAGEGARFPVPPFNATVWQSAGIPNPNNAEIVRVTSLGTDTFQIIRAQEGTTARAIAVGDLIAETITAKTLQDIETQAALLGQANTFTNPSQRIVSAASPGLLFRDTDGTPNTRVWRIETFADGYGLVVRPLLDDETTGPAFALYVDPAGDVAVKRDLFEKGRTTPIGHWIPVPYSAGNFTVSGSGTWAVASGNVLSNSYTLIGKLLIWNLWLSGTTVTGTPNNLVMNLPAGLTGTTIPVRCARVANQGICEVMTYPVNTTQLYLSRADGLFAAGTTDLMLGALVALV